MTIDGSHSTLLLTFTPPNTGILVFLAPHASGKDTSMLGTVPRLDINVATMTGIYPTLETTVGQIVLLSVYLVASLYVLVLRPKRQKALASMRKSRAEVDEQQTN